MSNLRSDYIKGWCELNGVDKEDLLSGLKFSQESISNLRKKFFKEEHRGVFTAVLANISFSIGIIEGRFTEDWE